LKKILFLLLLCLIYIPQQTDAQTSKKEYIVMFKENINWNIIEQTGVDVLDSYPSISSVFIEAEETEVEQLQQSTDILNLQLNEEYKIQGQKVPNGFAALNLTADYRSYYTGKGVDIAILDTGVDPDHPDLNVMGGICVLNSSCTNGYVDDNGHGTHVAGILAALDNDRGILGVAPDANLYAVKAMDSTGSGTTATILSGVEWAINNHIDILNMSITTEKDDAALKKIIDRAYSEGLLIVAAAGNNGTSNGDADSILFPARYPNVIAVGAINDQDKRVSLSATGPALEIMAPGYNIYSTVPKISDSFDGIRDGYSYMTGTSMAAPYISGLLALYKEQYSLFTNVQIRELLTSNAKDLGVAGRDEKYGFGLAQIKDSTVPLPAGNQVDAAVDKGKITFSIKRSNVHTKVEVKSPQAKDKINIPEDAWTDFALAGNYEYTFLFTFENGDRSEVNVPVAVQDPHFLDLSSRQWFMKHMVYLYNKEIVKGYEDGGVHPYQPITRGEAVALIGRALEMNETMRDTIFKDVASSYFASGYIQSAYENQIVKGFTDITFKPGQYVTRAEMAILIAKAYELKSEANVKFTDVSLNVTGYKEIAALVDSHITKGYSDGTFRPYQKITRSEFAVFLARAEDENFK
jgi:subtilisin family serine protease